MPQSMTGIGVGRSSRGGWRATVELRSVNHRHLDLRFRHSGLSAAVQQALSAAFKARIARGHVSVRVDLERDQNASPEVRVDLPLAAALKRAADKLADAVDGQGAVDLAWLVTVPGVLELAQPDQEDEAIAGLISEAGAEAVDGLLLARRNEGAHLAKDLRERIQQLQALHGEVATLAAELVPARRAKLRERLTEVAQEFGAQVDQGRLEQELVLFADRIDITEELVRLQGHLTAFEAALGKEQPGRQLGFLVQELLREVNTIGSKSGALQVTERVIAAKVEIERLREQVLNLA